MTNAIASRPRGSGVPCSATTKRGAPCPNQAHVAVGLCHVHRPDERCRRVNSKTKKRCGNRSNGSGFCDVHDFTRRKRQAWE